MEWSVEQEEHELLQRYLAEHGDMGGPGGVGGGGGEYFDHPPPDDEDYGDYYGDYYYEDEEDEMGGGGYYDDDEYTRISVSELADRCVLPTLHQAILTIYPLLALCLAVRICVLLSAKYLSASVGRPLCHALNAVCGVVALHLFFEENLLFLVMLAILSYSLLALISCKCRGWSGVATSIVTLVYLLACELLVVKETEWHRIRGAQMVLAMKIISLAFELDNGSVLNLPEKLEYAGYTFHVGTVIFGPWITFHDYTNTLNGKEKKMDFWWFARCVRSLGLSLLCIVVSTCVIHWLLLDGAALWVLAFRDAQSFRFSHYFVSYLSEATALLSGVAAVAGGRTGGGNGGGGGGGELSVCNSIHVEAPRSLVEVVMHWNIPMHTWLKTYVFKTVRPYSKFAAILATYTASSILHGVNFQLSAVLLSLGFYSYVEYVLRERLSKVYSACIGAKRCKPDCGHAYQRMHPNVIGVNLLLSALTVFHLAYLGLMFDSSPSEDRGYDMEHTVSKWGSLSYASHWVALATYIFYLLI